MSSTNGSTFGRMLSQMDAKQISALPAGESSCGLSESELRTLASELANWLRGEYALEVDKLIIQPKFDAFVKRIAATPVPVTLRFLPNPGDQEEPPVDEWPKTYGEALSGLAWCNTKLAQRLIALEQRDAAREERIAELEATALRDADVWKPEKVFRANDLTTYRGGLWRAREPNSNVRPGTSKVWRLMHKTESGGRDDR